VLATLIRLRRPLVVTLHLVLIVIANYVAFWLRFDGNIPTLQWSNFVGMLPWLVAIRMATFMPFRLFQGLWRYTGLSDLLNILSAVSVSSLVFVAIVRFGFVIHTYPRSVFVIDALVLLFSLSAVRLVRRVHRDFQWRTRGRRVLIVGAGDAGEMIVRDMKNNPFYYYQPVGFLDDDPAKIGRRIHGVRVLGSRAAIEQIISTHHPDEVIIAMPTVEPSVLRQVVRSLEHHKLPIKILPNLSDVLTGKVAVNQIRTLSAEDLLARPPVALPTDHVRALIAGKRVLVTGAGGSIGSELCRQIASFGPARLVMLDQYENGLFAVDGEIRQRWPGVPIEVVVASVTDAERIDGVMKRFVPEIVFHAAAHKHVPLMEANRCEAVKNNVYGTRVVAEAADRHKVGRFVLISTDKAVNPMSVMGATKRVAERLVQYLGARSSTCFVAVRFGNVLNSNGSVVPMFMDQIKRGGPVTVTHPDIRRFFMLIPEAVQLVLHAATLGVGGAIYMLEMGEPVKIADMARNLIRLCGYLPDDEIPVVFTGLRPGEKLYEELVGSDESAEPAGVEKLQRIVVTTAPDESTFELELRQLETSALRADDAAVTSILQRLVPTFTSTSTGVPAPAAADVPRDRAVGER
jgi:FlaA1/EpsC-like NDP-sugar epimerase